MNMKKLATKFKWEENVLKAKEYNGLRNRNQMVIARLAAEVCEIKHGGSHQRDLFGLTRFAKDVGLNPRLLSAWVCVYKNVFMKLTKEEQQSPRLTYTKLARIATRIDRTASRALIAKEFDAAINGSQLGQVMERYLYDFRSAASNFQNRGAALKCKESILQEYLFYCNIITRNINNDRPDLKEADNRIATTSGLRNLSAKQAFSGAVANHGKSVLVGVDGLRMRVSKKDREIAIFMKKKAGFLTPTEIGMIIGKHTSSNATAWSGRSLLKLTSLGLVERNKFGHYKWIGA